MCVFYVVILSVFCVPERLCDDLMWNTHCSGLWSGCGACGVAVHCKAGKGRTGTMIICYMLYVQAFKTVEAAMNTFAENRSEGTPKSLAPTGSGSGGSGGSGGAGPSATATAVTGTAIVTVPAPSAAAVANSESTGDEPRGVDQASQVRWIYDWHKLLHRPNAQSESLTKAIDALATVKRTLAYGDRSIEHTLNRCIVVYVCLVCVCCCVVLLL